MMRTLFDLTFREEQNNMIMLIEKFKFNYFVQHSDAIVISLFCNRHFAHFAYYSSISPADYT